MHDSHNVSENCHRVLEEELYGANFKPDVSSKNSCLVRNQMRHVRFHSISSLLLVSTLMNFFLNGDLNYCYAQITDRELLKLKKRGGLRIIQPEIG